jgi:hypothetical protein
MQLAENDLNCTGERIPNTSFGFVNLLKRHGKPWMCAKVRRET